MRIIYDHRVMDGATVARALARLKEILNTVVEDELRSLDESRTKADNANLGFEPLGSA